MHLNLRFFILVVMLAVVASQAVAQQVTTGVAGQVFDQADNPLRGATIEVVHVPTGTIRFTDSVANGRYQLTGLRVGGPYRITVSREGFESETVEGVHLRLGELEALDVQLVSVEVTDRIVVTATALSEVFRADRMGVGSTIGSDQIDDFASISRSINDYIRLDPRATVVDQGRNEISIGGGHNRMNDIRIDGVSANDSFGLNPDAQPGVRQPVAIDWL